MRPTSSFLEQYRHTENLVAKDEESAPHTNYRPFLVLTISFLNIRATVILPRLLRLPNISFLEGIIIIIIIII
jgi:hypothetical protein